MSIYLRLNKSTKSLLENILLINAHIIRIFGFGHKCYIQIYHIYSLSAKS